MKFSSEVPAAGVSSVFAAARAVVFFFYAGYVGQFIHGMFLVDFFAMFDTIFNAIFCLGPPRHLLVQRRVVVLSPEPFAQNSLNLAFHRELFVDN